nr:MAG TPA: hypothetical protein [Crassvirales sp.]
MYLHLKPKAVFFYPLYTLFIADLLLIEPHSSAA